MDVQLHSQRLESDIFDSPQIRHLAVGIHLKLLHLLEEVVDIIHIVFKNLLSGIPYKHAAHNND